MIKKVLTTGERVKELRINLDITQKYLAKRANINRSLVTLIENGKRKLTEKIASKLAKTFGEIANERGLINGNITKEWLLETQENQTSNIMEEYLRELKSVQATNYEKDIRQKINEIKLFAKNHVLEELTEIEMFKCLGEALMSIQELEDAYKYFESYKNSILMYPVSEELNKTHNKSDIKEIKKVEEKKIYEKLLLPYANMQVIKFMMNEYKGGIILGNHVIDMVNKYNLQNSYMIPRVVYNTALAYWRNQEINECLKTIDLLLSVHNQSNYFNQKGENLKAKCALRQGRMDEALNLWIKQLDNVNINEGISPKIAILENICWTYIEQDNYKEVLRYAELLDHIDFNALSKYDKLRNSYYLLYTEYYLKREARVIELFHLCFSLSCELNDKDIQYKSYLILARFYIECEEERYEDAYKIVEHISDNIKTIISEKVADVLHELSEYFKNIDNNNDKREKTLRAYTILKGKFYNKNEFEI